jgi:two-component system phosphate regulon sensor histidine kinase PhoR
MSLIVSVWWGYNTGRQSITSRAQSLKPFLEERFELNKEQLPTYVFNQSIHLLDAKGNLLIKTGIDPSFTPTLSPTLSSRDSLTYTENHLIYVMPLRPDQRSVQGYAVLIDRLPLINAHILLRASGLFGVAWIVLRMTSRTRRQQDRDKKELLAEIDAFHHQQMDMPLKLSIQNPFKPVADTINQLTASRERQDRVLTEQHHHQQVLLSNMSEGILVLDTDMRITGVNPVAARWLDLGNPLRIQGSIFYNLCRQPRLLNLIDELTSTESLKEIFLRLERPNAHDRILKVRGSPLIDKDQTLGVLILLQDVTTLRRLETLRQDFVANVSHELRTPLTSIKGYAELISDDPSAREDVEQYTEKILKQSSRMINIIEDLLSLTRIENQDANPSLQATEIKPVLERAAHLCEEPANLRDLQIEIDCPETLQAEIHPPLLEQAIHNIAHNAVKYTHPGTVITLRGIVRDSSVWIEIEDLGPGIPLSAQGRLFERFFRVDKARSRAIGGTGLGLSIAKHIAHLHHGEIGVISEPGNGATFWIRLPNLQGQPDKTSVTASASRGINPA